MIKYDELGRIAPTKERKLLSDCEHLGDFILAEDAPSDWRPHLPNIYRPGMMIDVRYGDVDISAIPRPLVEMPAQIFEPRRWNGPPPHYKQSTIFVRVQ